MCLSFIPLISWLDVLMMSMVIRLFWAVGWVRHKIALTHLSKVTQTRPDNRIRHYSVQGPQGTHESGVDHIVERRVGLKSLPPRISDQFIPLGQSTHHPNRSITSAIRESASGDVGRYEIEWNYKHNSSDASDTSRISSKDGGDSR